MSGNIPVETAFGMNEATSESERTLRAAHFLRQSIITRRKLTSSVNRRWCRNQQLISKSKPWNL